MVTNDIYKGEYLICWINFTLVGNILRIINTKSLLIILSTILFCLTSSIGWSAYFQKVLVAYNNGEFVFAFNEYSN